MSPIIDHEKRERPVMLPDGTLVRLRPIRSDDGPALVALFGRLSERTIYQRFFTVRRSLPAEWGHLFTHVDYDRRMAIVAECDTKNGPEVAGVVRTFRVALVRPRAGAGRPGYCAVQPPSMTSSLPVTNDDSSDARYSTP